MRRSKINSPINKSCQSRITTNPRSTNHLLLVLRAERADGLSGPPDLEVADLLHLSLVLLSVVRLGVVVEGALGLLAGLDGVVQVVKDGLEGVLELGAPVDGTATGGGRAGLVHPVHAVGTDERVERLGRLLDGLVEGLRWGVALLAENLVLGEEHTVDTAHKAASLTVEVRVDLLLKGGQVHVSGADGNTEGGGLLESLASDILVDSDGGVDATALAEKGADSAAGSLGCDEDDIDISWHFDLGELLEHGGESVREVKSLWSVLVM